METTFDFEEEVIPFHIEILGNFRYRYKPRKFDADTTKNEIYEILSDAICKFEAFDTDIELQDVEYNIET